MTLARKLRPTITTGKISTGKRWRRITSPLSSSVLSAKLSRQLSSTRIPAADRNASAVSYFHVDDISSHFATTTTTTELTAAPSAAKPSGKESQPWVAVRTMNLNGKIEGDSV